MSGGLINVKILDKHVYLVSSRLVGGYAGGWSQCMEVSAGRAGVVCEGSLSFIEKFSISAEISRH